MADVNKIDNNIEKVDINITNKLREKYSESIELIKLVNKHFKRLGMKSANKLLQLILNEQNVIHISEIKDNVIGFKHNSRKDIDDNDNIKVETIQVLKEQILRKISNFEASVMNSIEGFDMKKLKGKNYCYLDKDMLYSNFNILICEESGEIDFCYNFDKPDIPVSFPDKQNTLQRAEMHILTYPILFDFPVEYAYSCPRCGTLGKKYACQTASTKSKYICEGIYNYINANGEPKSKVCGVTLYPDEKISKIKQCYYYEISYVDDEGNRNNISGISFNKYKPGFYDVAFFNIINVNKLPSFHIIDIKEETPKEIVLPPLSKKRNYLFDLQEAFDDFIGDRTGLSIYGLFPIKIALILQMLANVLGNRLIYNIQIVGDASTGKSTVLKYYSFLLSGPLNLSSNGASISIPALRGTRASILLFNKNINIITIGFLGMYKSIHIDEANDDKDMVQSLKTFLLEDNYSYDKAGGSGVFHKRTAHVNLSENLDYNYLGQYRGMIRKTYKEMEDVQIGDLEKPDWDEDWDLHLPIFQYTDNPYLHKIIKDIRTRMQLEQKWWIDGYEYALHERFPFYFYVVNTKESEVFNDTIRKNATNEIISENFELIKALKNDNINKLFEELKKYKKSDSDNIESMKKVDKILDSYGIKADARVKNFYYTTLVLSRIINKRRKVNEQDYDLIRWFIEKTNCKLELSDTDNYDVQGPPDMEEINDVEEKIRESEKKTENMFSGDLGSDFGGDQYS